VIWLAAAPAVAAAAYYLLVIVAAVKWGRPPGLPLASGPPRRPAPLSILKPIHGRDPHFYQAIVSHASQKYPEFEILFGVSDPIAIRYCAELDATTLPAPAAGQS